MTHQNRLTLTTVLAQAAILVILLNPTFCKGEDATMMIMDFTAGATEWSTINDVVMGGISSSEMTLTDDAAVFRGTVSLDNNGGFASARSLDGAYDLSPFDGLRIKVRGDGKLYSFRIRSKDTLPGVSYRSKFNAPVGEFQEIFLPFSDFKPVFRGRLLTDHPALDATRVIGFGLLIADGQEGDFRLDLSWIAGARVQS